MAENLAYVPYACAPDSQCGIWVYGYYGEGSFYENYTTYGCLYDWETAMEVCPEGWHLPSDEEWMELERFLGMKEDELYEELLLRGINENVSGKLGGGSALWNNKNENSTNESGFSAVPGGTRVYGDHYRYRGIGEGASFWTSTYYENDWLWIRTIESQGITRLTCHEGFGLSIRCVRD